MPELGSKISLISKADIRYEGRLFTVDPQECTIALANGELKFPSKPHFRRVFSIMDTFRPFRSSLALSSRSNGSLSLLPNHIHLFNTTKTVGLSGGARCEKRDSLCLAKATKKKLLKRKERKVKWSVFAHICKFASSLMMPCVCKPSRTSWTLSELSKKNTPSWMIQISNNLVITSADLFSIALSFMATMTR